MKFQIKYYLSYDLHNCPMAILCINKLSVINNFLLKLVLILSHSVEHLFILPQIQINTNIRYM